MRYYFSFLKYKINNILLNHGKGLEGLNIGSHTSSYLKIFLAVSSLMMKNKNLSKESFLFNRFNVVLN